MNYYFMQFNFIKFIKKVIIFICENDLTIAKSYGIITMIQKERSCVLIHNLKNKDTPKPLLTEDEVELLTSPLELAAYKDAITDAMFKGTKRNIESEENEKNAPVE